MNYPGQNKANKLAFVGKTLRVVSYGWKIWEGIQFGDLTNLPPKCFRPYISVMISYHRDGYSNPLLYIHTLVGKYRKWVFVV